jgi:pimeloyl-ACP methyl ester carboxylesterase
VQSIYIGLFRLPLVPEALLRASNGRLLHRALARSGLPDERAAAYVEAMLEPGALEAAIGWYRAIELGSAGGTGPSRVPTTYVWSSGDAALGRSAAERTGTYVDAPYRFEVIDDVSHWLPEVEPHRVAELIEAQIRDATG